MRESVNVCAPRLGWWVKVCVAMGHRWAYGQTMLQDNDMALSVDRCDESLRAPGCCSPGPKFRECALLLKY